MFSFNFISYSHLLFVKKRILLPLTTTLFALQIKKYQKIVNCLTKKTKT